jgi:hypothetical protein
MRSCSPYSLTTSTSQVNGALAWVRNGNKLGESVWVISRGYNKKADPDEVGFF